MEAAVHKRNLESSILFMQQEHAATLKALHEEIHKLQKKCTDLTFQLTMHGISVDNEGDVDSRLQQVHQQLQESQGHENMLESQLSEGRQKLQHLEQELRVQKKRHMDEMRRAAHTISSLKAEVEAKSNNIAFLTTELHHLKVKAKEGGGQGSDTGPTIVRCMQSQYSHMPAPPREMLTNSARLRHRGARPVPSLGVHRTRAAPSTSSLGVGVSEADSLAHCLRGTSASTRSSGSDSPDISPFVHKDLEMGVPVVEVKKTAPLPPIVPSNPGLGERDPHLDKADLQQVVMAKRGRRAISRPRPSTPEVATLAVDKVSDANWKRPSQSHSSEYN